MRPAYMLALTAALVMPPSLLADCAPWQGPRTILRSGARHCAMHHVALITHTVFTVTPGTLFHEFPDFAKIRKCFPNLLEEGYVRKRSTDFPEAEKATYCPRCEAEADKLRAESNRHYKSLQLPRKGLTKSLQPTAGRSDASLKIMKTPRFQAALAPARGG
jgi:hypothetical protein